jgi:hypothetical protein
VYLPILLKEQHILSCGIADKIVETPVDIHISNITNHPDFLVVGLGLKLKWRIHELKVDLPFMQMDEKKRWDNNIILVVLAGKTSPEKEKNGFFF